jgi:hypothetical protein
VATSSAGEAATEAAGAAAACALGVVNAEIAISGPHAIPGLLLLVETLSVDKKVRRLFWVYPGYKNSITLMPVETLSLPWSA